MVLGRLALRDGNIAAAKAFLLEAGKSTGSPQMNSFGPNLSLAKDLLQKGEKEVVIKTIHVNGSGSSDSPTELVFTPLRWARWLTREFGVAQKWIDGVHKPWGTERNTETNIDMTISDDYIVLRMEADHDKHGY